MSAYLIAGTELHNVYLEETGLVRITKFDSLDNLTFTDKEVTRCFIGNLEVTQHKLPPVPAYKGIILNKKAINSQLKNIQLIDNYIGIIIADDCVNNIEIDKITKTIELVRKEFCKLDINEPVKLLIVEQYDY